MHSKPKKGLGQNFLTDRNIRGKIINACNLGPCDIVLEIGAGRGELTRLLADKVSFVYALEIDALLCRELRDNLEGYDNVEIINRDILKLDLKNYFGRIKGKLKVAGNIPYYITSPIIEKLFRHRERIDTIFLTVQKEFAQRITALPGRKEYGSFTCFVRYYTKPKILFYIRKTCFYPVPKVDSAFLRMEIKGGLPVKKEGEKLLFRIIREAFSKRRKTLRNSLEGVIPQEKLERFFKAYGIDRNIRPERLSLEQFIDLSRA